MTSIRRVNVFRQQNFYRNTNKIRNTQTKIQPYVMNKPSTPLFISDDGNDKKELIEILRNQDLFEKKLKQLENKSKQIVVIYIEHSICRKLSEEEKQELYMELG